MSKESKEAVLLTKRHLLVCVEDEFQNLIPDETEYLTPKNRKELDFVKKNFCGVVVSNLNDLKKAMDATSEQALIYVAGDVGQVHKRIQSLKSSKNRQIFVVKELSYNQEEKDGGQMIPIDIGEIPINVHNVGVYFRKLFNAENKDYFDELTHQHEFQKLRESNKPTPAFRTGIYLTPVTLDEKKEEVKFHLLRCSTNLCGPSENFRTTDLAVVDKVNQVTAHCFDQTTPLNHVLAQVYHNHKGVHKGKEKKSNN